MDTLILENFRCFAGRHEVPLRPLTLLVGENSTGKTSFLAACHRALETCRFGEAPDFSEDPFDLGAFETIANNRAKNGRNGNSFMLGFGTPSNALAREIVWFEACFADSKGLPDLVRWRSWVEGWHVEFFRQSKAERWSAKEKMPSSPERLRKGFAADVLRIRLMEIDFDDPNSSAEDTRHFRAIKALATDPIPAIPIGPVRARPKRTHELNNVQFHPQGEHVPVAISQFYGSKGWEQIARPLQEFATAAGLFDEISVKYLGEENSGPFQIMVKLHGLGRKRNLVDVGYGVSQALPMAFDLIRGPSGALYTIQQPEVHLHPKAQAELGTLLGKLAKLHHKQFLIETHSDYLIDRVRMDVRDTKNIGPDDVVILYFEKHKTGVKIFPIYIDQLGNLVGAPPTYRQFFLEEESRFLGVS